MKEARNPETAKSAIWKHEALFQTLIDITKYAVIAIGEDGLIFLFNPAAEQMFGYGAKDLIGKNLDSLMPVAYRKKHRNYIKTYFGAGKSRGALGKVLEFPGVRKDGETFPMAISLSAGRSANQKFVVAIARDISERKRVSAAIQSSEERYRTLQENLPLGIYRATRDGKKSRR